MTAVLVVADLKVVIYIKPATAVNVITTVFSHATTVVVCVGCNTVLCTPTGGKARLTEGCSFRKKQH
ncbi:40S ribosomal protein S27-like [Parelaphostrongylus tenuis]|uniref:40S ribosomal protein S27-like n=1 Tax=Parelaphostrongylus tenuis TaxID=148309 RepID=A0AAD5QU72_PARTN|nr:40S ribosomal protein S27-like [Parelaphostrongylus tenuis]